MTAKRFVDKYLQNCQYDNELTEEIVEIAQEEGLVVAFGRIKVYGVVCELCGAANDSICYGNITPDGLVTFGDTGDSGKVVLKENITITASVNFNDKSWLFDINTPHETFDIYVDGKKHSRGIVFPYDRVKPYFTNYERIQAMSLKEMATFLEDIKDRCPGSKECCECPLYEACSCWSMLDWLTREDSIEMSK